MLILTPFDFPGGATKEKAGTATVQMKNENFTEIKTFLAKQTNYFHSLFSTAEIQKEHFGFPQQLGESFSRECICKLLSVKTPTVGCGEFVRISM